ncbi:MAG TPA: succinate dehydrogenase, hydrophobic membrane anchor protein [Casimicrobiaceae bacterium]|nr:succinate dehydrogenase, hydrophobic membrane anchor protein [Casimicrobiaceae bacterium]
MVKRVVVGAHYGSGDWLAQRITAVVMAVYTLLILGIALYNGGLDYALWQQLFAGTAFRIATLLFALALFWHAWIGVRDIWMDYIKPAGLRLTFEVLTVVVLLAYAAWLVQIMWGRA